MVIPFELLTTQDDKLHQIYNDDDDDEENKSTKNIFDDMLIIHVILPCDR